MGLEKIPSKIIIREAVKRLAQIVKDKTGFDLKYGDFISSVHEGYCRKVDFNLKDGCLNIGHLLLMEGEMDNVLFFEISNVIKLVSKKERETNGKILWITKEVMNVVKELRGKRVESEWNDDAEE